MSRTKKLMVAGAVLACVVGIIALKVARATPPTGVTNTLIAGPVVLDDIDVRAHTPDYMARVKTKGLSDAYVAHLTIAPGGDTGWHSHPGPVFTLITAGAGTEYEADDPTLTPAVFPAGTGFAENPGNVHILRNEGTTNLELVVFFLVPKGAPPRIDEPAP